MQSYLVLIDLWSAISCDPDTRFALTWWPFRNRFRTLSFEQNYNQYFVNAFIINLNKYLHFRCEKGRKGPIKTLLMFISTSKMLNHIRFCKGFDSYLMSKSQSGSKYKLPCHSYVFSTSLLFYLLIFWISFGPALKCMMNPSYPAHHIVIYEACLHICLLIRYFTLTEFN